MNNFSDTFLLDVAVVACVGLASLVAIRLVRWARIRSPMRAFAGWALLLLGVGMNPQPPPQEQVEVVIHERKVKKEAESGDPPDSGA